MGIVEDIVSGIARKFKLDTIQTPHLALFPEADELVDKVKSIFDRGEEWFNTHVVTPVVDNVVDPITDTFTSLIVEPIEGLIAGLDFTDLVVDPIAWWIQENVVDKLEDNVITPITDWITDNVITPLNTNVVQPVIEAFDANVVQPIKDELASIRDDFDVINWLSNKWIEIREDIGDKVASWFNAVTESLRGDYES